MSEVGDNRADPAGTSTSPGGLPEPQAECVASTDSPPASAGVLSLRAQVLRKPPPARFAAIDVGTNSIHLLMAEISPEGDFRVLGSDKDIVQMGRGGFARHVLTARAMSAGMETLRRYQRMAELKGIRKIRAVATSAVREAHNGGDFVNRVREELGLELYVISSVEEGRLIYLAVRHAVDLGEADNLIVDIGGGSVELIVGNATEARFIVSLKLGSARLSELFLRSDRLAPGQIKSLRRHLRSELDPVLDVLRPFPLKRCIGTAGSVKNVAVICGRLRGKHADDGGTDLRIAQSEAKELVARLIGTDRLERLKVPGMDPRRVDTCLPTAMLLHRVMKSLGLLELQRCDLGLREGVVLDYIGQHRAKLLARATWPDPRTRSVIHLAERCNYRKAHAEHVARLAVQLFDALAELHGLDHTYRELLHFACLLHDVGHMISHQGHHKHSYYLIRNGGLKGFADQEIEVIANVARYHRKGRPQPRHYTFQQLRPVQRAAVRRLSILLRLADSLDRTQAGVVEAVTVEKTAVAVVLGVHTRQDAELELWTARRLRKLFADEFKARLVITLAAPIPTEAPRV